MKKSRGLTIRAKAINGVINGLDEIFKKKKKEEEEIISKRNTVNL